MSKEDIIARIDAHIKWQREHERVKRCGYCCKKIEDVADDDIIYMIDPHVGRVPICDECLKRRFG